MGEGSVAFTAALCARETNVEVVTRGVRLNRQMDSVLVHAWNREVKAQARVVFVDIRSESAGKVRVGFLRVLGLGMRVCAPTNALQEGHGL